MTRQVNIPPFVLTEPYLLERLSLLQRICLVLVGALSLTILAGWLIPAFSQILPDGWSLMKCNTALAALFSASSLFAFRASRKSVSRGLAAMVLFLSIASLLEYVLGTQVHLAGLGLDTVFAADAGSPRPGRMSPQTGIAFFLLGTSLMLLGVKTRRASKVADLLAFALCVFVLFAISGNVFGALHLFGLSMKTRTSPQTLVALFLLTSVVFINRAEDGVFSVLFGSGVGSRIARVASPFALFLPLILEMARGVVIKLKLLSPEYATAVVASTAATLAFALILLLAWRIDQLQREISDLSLRDDLTGLYNRRGFYLLASQARRLAQRADAAYSVLYLDLDNLKKINDRYGHDLGSDFLIKLGSLMKQTFRETDVIGRIGGDEFVVAGEWDSTCARQLAEKLEVAALRSHTAPKYSIPLTFSWGHATAERGSIESLDSLISRADNAMYELKRHRKLAGA